MRFFLIFAFALCCFSSCRVQMGGAFFGLSSTYPEKPISQVDSTRRTATAIYGSASASLVAGYNDDYSQATHFEGHLAHRFGAFSLAYGGRFTRGSYTFSSDTAYSFRVHQLAGENRLNYEAKGFFIESGVVFPLEHLTFEVGAQYNYHKEEGQFSDFLQNVGDLGILLEDPPLFTETVIVSDTEYHEFCLFTSFYKRYSGVDFEYRSQLIISDANYSKISRKIPFASSSMLRVGYRGMCSGYAALRLATARPSITFGLTLSPSNLLFSRR